MTILLRQVKIADQHSPFNGKVKDILLQDAVLVSIQDHYDGKADQIVDIPGTIVSTGWVDPFTNFCDPGFEHKETLMTGAAAAQAGVHAYPNERPWPDEGHLEMQARSGFADHPAQPQDHAALAFIDGVGGGEQQHQHRHDGGTGDDGALGQLVEVEIHAWKLGWLRTPGTTHGGLVSPSALEWRG